MTNERTKQDQNPSAGMEHPADGRYLLEEPYPEEPKPKAAPAKTPAAEPYDRWGDEELHEARISGLPLPARLKRRL